MIHAAYQKDITKKTKKEYFLEKKGEYHKTCIVKLSHMQDA